MEAEKILSRLIMVDVALCERDISRVVAAKRQAVEQDGLLEYWPTTEGLGRIAGLSGLKTWLGKRRATVVEPERAAAFGLPFPKGILLTGTPGCGKSVCAKAVAHEWRLPLLRLDLGMLFSKYIGDPEKSFKRAMATAERMAPIILCDCRAPLRASTVGERSYGELGRRPGGPGVSVTADTNIAVVCCGTT